MIVSVQTQMETRNNYPLEKPLRSQANTNESTLFDRDDDNVQHYYTPCTSPFAVLISVNRFNILDHGGDI